MSTRELLEELLEEIVADYGHRGDAGDVLPGLPTYVAEHLAEHVVLKDDLEPCGRDLDVVDKRPFYRLRSDS